MAEEHLQLLGRGGQVDLIPGLQLEVAGGDDGLLAPSHGADQHPDPDGLIEVAEPHPVEGGVGRQSVFHQLQAALGEGLQLHGRGEPQHTGDLPGGGLLRIDGHSEAQLLPHEAELYLVIRVADAGDGVLHPQLFGNQAGQNVDLVAGGGGDQQVGLVGLRLLLDAIAGAVAAHAHDVIDVDDIVDQLGMLVDHGDLMLRG